MTLVLKELDRNINSNMFQIDVLLVILTLQAYI